MDFWCFFFREKIADVFAFPIKQVFEIDFFPTLSFGFDSRTKPNKGAVKNVPQNMRSWSVSLSKKKKVVKIECTNKKLHVSEIGVFFKKNDSRNWID